MTKKNKRWQRLTQNLREVRFSDLDTILIESGYERRQSAKGSSHYVYSHPQADSLVVLVSHGKNDILPEYQVKKAIKSLQSVEEL
jgi:predicted RNA binding protein YcfA (HicA-like mRNA interferase family)